MGPEKLDLRQFGLATILAGLSVILYTCLGDVTEQPSPTPIPDFLTDLKVAPSAQDNEAIISLFENEIGYINLTITDIQVSGAFEIGLRIPKEYNGYFEATIVDSSGDEVIGPASNISHTTNFQIKGIRLSIGEFEIVAIDSVNSETFVVHGQVVYVSRKELMIARVIRYLVLVMVMVIIFLIGATTDLEVIYKILRRPWGVIIGLLCQFVIMPATAYAFANLFNIDGAGSVGFILDGSCPGGTISNILSVIMDLDYVLSITMTFFSTLFALGMMPLNLYIYGRNFTAGETIETPFVEIIIQMASLVIPLGIGLFIGYKWPNAKVKLEKYLKPASGLGIFVLLCSDLPFNLYIFDVPGHYYAATLLFPLVGLTLGIVFAKLACLHNRSAVTVGIETGVQNAVLAVTVLYFFYPQPQSDLGSRIPYLILIFTSIEGAIAGIIYIILQKFVWHGSPWDDDLGTPSEEEEKKRPDENQNGSVPSVSATIPTVESQAELVNTDTLAYSNKAFEEKP